MPTILLCKGWRVCIFANEGNEPIHVHCRKGSAKGKFWIFPESYEIKMSYVRHMTRNEERDLISLPENIQIQEVHLIIGIRKLKILTLLHLLN